MKPIHGKNCSCTSCVFQNDSKHRPSVQKFIAEGSKIDKLYLGKYIPLREQKLLTKLVKTRAIYDDVRAEILSSSSVNARAEKPKADNDTEKSSAQAILDIVDFVDRGGVKANKSLSSCCSCCICQPDGVHKHGRAHVHKHHRHSHHGGPAHVHPRTRGHHKGHRGGSVSSVTKARKPAKGGRKPTRANIKSIKSVPCVCTYDISGMIKKKSKADISGMIKKKSKALMKRMQAQKAIASIDTSHVEFNETSFERQGAKKAKDFAIKSYQKLKESEMRRGLEYTARKSMKKIKDSKVIVKHKMKVSTKRSMESLAEVSQKIKRASQKIKHKALKLKEQVQTVPRERPSGLKSVPKDNKFSIKKDSIAKFKEKLQQRNENEDLDQSYYVESDVAKKQKREIKERKSLVKKGTKVVKPSNRKSQIHSVKSVSSSTKPTNKISPAICECEVTTKDRPSPASVTSAGSQLVNISSSVSIETKMIKEKNIKQTQSATESTTNTKINVDQLAMKENKRRHLKKDVSVDKISKVGVKKHKKDAHTGAHALKRCFCTLKLKPKKNRHTHSKMSVTKGTTSRTALKPSAESIQTAATELQDNSLKRGLKRHSSSTGTTVERKSISTLYTNNQTPTPSKIVQARAAKKEKHTTTKHKLRRCFCILKFKPEKTQTSSNNTNTSRSVTTQVSENLIKKRKIHHKLRPYECEPGICIPDECDPHECLKLIEKRNVHNTSSNTENRRTRKLRPYECEPGICIPDECDPYECLKLIEKRKLQNTFSSTDNRKTKSVSSITSQHMPPKVKRVQSSIVSYDTGVSARKYKENSKAVKAVKGPKDVRTTPNIPQRQAVRIGSTFSFSIEFYKDKPAFDNEPPPRYESKPIAQPKKIKNVPREKKIMKEHGSQGDMQQETKSVTVQVVKQNKNALIGTVIKRCFCTLKLRKEQTKNLKEKEEMTRGTMTPESKQKIQPVMISRATKTKGKKYKYHDRQLEPYECEPNFCIPGECDPYECLERIKRRGHSKERSTSPAKIKRRSGSSNSESSVSIATSPLKVPYKEQTVSANFHQPKNNATEQKEKHIPKHSSSKEASRQAVKIGSTFSFDIEFYKDKKPEIRKNISTIPQKIKYTNNNKNKVKDKGARKKMSSSNQSSQFEDQRRIDKSTGIKPILKRCFCTLQLLNKKDKRKQKNAPSFLSRTTNVYTVSRVGKTSFAAQNYLSDYQTNIFDKLSTDTEINSRFQIESYYSQTNKQGSQNISLVKDFTYIRKLKNADDVSCDVKFIKEKKSSTDSKSTIDFKGLSNSIIKNIENDIDQPAFGESCSSESNLSVRHTQSKHINSFLRKCFYAMNMKTEKRQHRLKPYECEPGVCIPYECDPYECKKLIDQRLRASKRSGTETSSKSSSNNYSRAKTKNQKLKTTDTKIATRQLATKKEPTVKKKPAPVIQYKTAPRPKQRQAVRIGSSFSFDIEVFKEKSPMSQSVSSKPEPIPREKKVKAVKTKPKKQKPEKQMKKTDKRINHSDQDTQSTSTRVNRGSSSSEPKLKRCFCTLKLKQSDKPVHEKKEKKVGNKKYKIDKKEIKMVSSNSTMTPPTKTKRKPKPYKLAPYECEPGFCTPGLCNPYECLEVIKKRNKGSEIKSTETRSDSSFTGVMKKRGKNVQSDSAGRKNRAIKVKQHKDSGNIAKVKEPKIIKQSARPPVAPERQVVRIGSSFSFNIEFYKDKSPKTENIQEAARELKIKRKRQKVNTKKNKKAKAVKSLNSLNISSESRELQTSQNTMASKLTATKLKRCFCTLKLQKQRKIAEGERRKQTQASQATNTKPYKEEATMYTRSVNTKKKFKLKPYECEPNVCIPGECDPYECYERIQKRLREFGTGTDNRKVRSASSSIDSHSRTKRNQYNKRNKYHKKGAQAKFKPKQKKQKVSSIPSMRAKKPPSEIIRPTQRQAVRIGSGFSFDIEFSKNRSLSVPRPARSKPSKITPVKKKTGGSQDKSSFRTTNSQSEFGSNIRSTTTNTTQRLKRCFCTLSLKKQIDKNNPKYAFPRSADRTKQVYRLEPYECEPNVCIPGKCDPYECLERIKRRNRKEFGTSTGPQRRSTGSSNTISSSTKARKNQKAYRRKQSDSSTTARQIVKKPKASHNQAVKIGSSFKFNVEFYKDRSYGDHALVESPPPAPVVTLKKSPPAPKPVRVKEQETQPIKYRANADTQISNVKDKEQSTGMNKILKRCFCTLKLLKQQPAGKGTKPEKAPKPTHKGTNSDIEEVKVILPPKGKDRATRTKTVPTQKLEPYECEPGFCIPGECDPYECLERIRKRDMRSQKAGTAKPTPICTACTASDSAHNRQTQAICTKPECKSKMVGNDAEKYIVEERRFKPIENPFRQTVHISSSFSFSVEFIKDGVPGSPEPRVCPEGVCRPKPSPPIPKHTKNVCTNDTCPNKNRKIQLDGSKLTDRGSGRDALLKRCFCTLKLQKEPSKKYKAHAKTHTGPYQPTNVSTDIGVGRYKLKPYECEPNVCIPGECDPYECLERIKRRQMKSSAIGTGPTNRSATTLTSVGTKMCRDTQCYKDPRRCQNTQCVVRRPPKPIEPRPAPIVWSPRPRGRQTLKYGTTFGFDIELFKDDTICKRKHTEQTGITYKPRPKKVVDQGSYGRRETQSRGNRCYPCTDSKASGIAPKLKRCFCTLKLMKGPYAKEMKTINYVSLQVKPPIMNKLKKPNENARFYNFSPSQQHNLSTKKTLSRKAKHLKPYECAPIICLGDQIKCDSFKSSKRKCKKLCPCESIGISYANNESHYLNTETKCVPPGKSKTLKSKIIVSTKYTKSSNKVQRFRNPKVTPSNFTESFINIDKISKGNSKNNTKKSKKNMNGTKKNWHMKVQHVKYKDKDVSKSLQRCSCTLNIQNNKTPYSKDVTLKRVSIKEEKNVTQNHKNNIKKSLLKYKNCKHDDIDDVRYVTNNAAKKSKPGMKQEYNTKNLKVFKNINSPPKYDFHKSVCLPGNGTKQLNDHKGLKPSSFWNGFTFKNIVHRITNIFSRSTKSKDFHKKQIDCTKSLVNKTTKITKHTNKADTIKTSKSDRHPIPNTASALKKTNSLKLGKNNKDKYIVPVDSKRRPYSKFQSGDAGHKDLDLLKNIMKPSPMTCNFYDNNIICAYCYAKYDRNIKQVKTGYMAPYANDNVVQLALTAPDCSILSQNYGGCKSVNKGTKPSKKTYSEYKEQLENNAGENMKSKSKKTTKSEIKHIPQAEPICYPDENDGKGDDITKNKGKKGKRETPKVVCQTKNPCACCKGGKQAGSLLCSILFGDKTIPPPDDTAPQPQSKVGSRSKKDKECDTVCKTKPVEEKGLIMKTMDKILTDITTPKAAKVEVCNYDPVLQMKLDSGSLNVLNRDEIFDKVRQLKITEAKDKLTPAELKRLHGDACRCCACQSMRHKKKKKGVTDEKTAGVKQLSMKDKLKAKLKNQAKSMAQRSMAGLHMGPRPCVCGSAPCARASKQDYLNEMAKRKRKLKPCVCGAQICKEEIFKMTVKKDGLSKKAAHKAKQKMKASSKISAKKKAGKEKGGKKGGKKGKPGKGGKMGKKKPLTKEQLGEMKKNLREFHLLEIHYGKVDAKRLKNQLKREKQLDREVRYGKPDNFCVLFNESILDLLQVVIRIITGLLRTMFRVVLHPKRTMRHLKKAIRSPKLAVIYIIEALENLGLQYALRRIWWRIRRSTCLLKLKRKLESWFLTYYLIHMFDTNPKTRRMRKQQTRRKRQSADFGCSLFMISLRKKPCMWCYYRYPWFYPHCVTVVRVLKTLLDTLLFILAVCVWSPLLLCMECCRALMCCTMCTG